jgi:hypothetical protein
MNRGIRKLVVGGVLMLRAINGQAQTRPELAVEGELAITIHLYNYAGIAPAVLAEAEATSDGLLAEAGVKTDRLDCTPGSPAKDGEDSCGRVSLATHFQMNLLKREGNFAGRSQTWLGFSVLPRGGQPGSLAYISVLRANVLRTPDASVGRVIGLAMAHELGHLLLGTSAHAFIGIMRAKWRKIDMADSAGSALRFTREESRLLRVAVDSRRKLNEALLRTGAKMH